MFFKFLPHITSEGTHSWPLKCILAIPKAATGGVLWTKLFLKILQISQENTCVEASFY